MSITVIASPNGTILSAIITQDQLGTLIDILRYQEQLRYTHDRSGTTNNRRQSVRDRCPLMLHCARKMAPGFNHGPAVICIVDQAHFEQLQATATPAYRSGNIALPHRLDPNLRRLSPWL